MLVLSRLVGERIIIGDDIVLEVLETRGDCVRVGVTAPREIPVRRAELLGVKRCDCGRSYTEEQSKCPRCRKSKRTNRPTAGSAE